MLDKALPQHTIRYLNQVLGEELLHVGPSEKTVQLPYFLQDAYEVWSGELLERPVVLACAKGRQSIGPQQLVQHAKHIHELLHAPVIMALPEIAPGERKRLIANSVAFVVPDRQLFAPQIGVILSERFGTEPRREQVLASPATQALLVWFLNQHPLTQTWHPFEEAAALGYTAMTATRAVRELIQFNLFELDVRGRSKYLKLVETRRQLWEKAKPHLRTPVMKTLWTYDQRILDVMGVRWAGESALARMSMINEPEQQVIAMTTDAVQKAKEEGVYFEPSKLVDGIAVQIWRYRPCMQSQRTEVDPLSLWLSLRDDRDDRIQMALGEIEEKFPW